MLRLVAFEVFPAPIGRAATWKATVEFSRGYRTTMHNIPNDESFHSFFLNKSLRVARSGNVEVLTGDCGGRFRCSD